MMENNESQVEKLELTAIKAGFVLAFFCLLGVAIFALFKSPHVPLEAESIHDHRSHKLPSYPGRGVINEACVDGIVYLISLDFGMVKYDKNTLLPSKCGALSLLDEGVKKMIHQDIIDSYTGMELESIPEADLEFFANIYLAQPSIYFLVRLHSKDAGIPLTEDNFHALTKNLNIHDKVLKTYPDLIF